VEKMNKKIFLTLLITSVMIGSVFGSTSLAVRTSKENLVKTNENTITITVHCFYDENENGEQDNGEHDAENMYVLLANHYILCRAPQVTNNFGKAYFTITNWEEAQYAAFAYDHLWFQIGKLNWMGGVGISKEDLDNGKTTYEIPLKDAVEPDGGTVSGEIRRRGSGEGAINAEVKLESTENDFELNATSHRYEGADHDDFGFFNIPVPGKYKITIKKEGYLVFSDKFKLERGFLTSFKHYPCIIMGKSKEAYVNNLALIRLLSYFPILNKLINDSLK
jgi:hypothetical protein